MEIWQNYKVHLNSGEKPFLPVRHFVRLPFAWNHLQQVKEDLFGISPHLLSSFLFILFSFVRHISVFWSFPVSQSVQSVPFHSCHYGFLGTITGRVGKRLFFFTRTRDFSLVGNNFFCLLLCWMTKDNIPHRKSNETFEVWHGVQLNAKKGNKLFNSEVLQRCFPFVFNVKLSTS